mmetsp:Transcript_1504/g.2171  ORF Transcript_1504/g.2171 Transcript_1504/m.2171 type:complete len:384 (-) Transcript_1504:103-1254(-)
MAPHRPLRPIAGAIAALACLSGILFVAGMISSSSHNLNTAPRVSARTSGQSLISAAYGRGMRPISLFQRARNFQSASSQHTFSSPQGISRPTFHVNSGAVASETQSEDAELPSNLKEAVDQAAESLMKANARGETLLRAGLFIEEMSRGSRQNLDLQEPRVLCRVAEEFAKRSNITKIKYYFANVGLTVQQKKWLGEIGSTATTSSLDRPPTLGDEELIVFVKPDIFGLSNAKKLSDKTMEIPFEERPAVLMLNENFGDQDDPGDGFLGVPQMETIQARDLKNRFAVAYYLEQVLSRQTGIIVLFKRYPREWKLFIADEGQYKKIREQNREPGEEEIFESVTDFNNEKQMKKLWQSFRWRKQVENFCDSVGIQKPFEKKGQKM